MPNKHYLPIDLSPFGHENDNSDGRTVRDSK